MQLTDKIIADYRKLCEMDSVAEGLDGVQVHSCFTNGSDTAREHGYVVGTSEFEDAVIYYTVCTARSFEII
jgi:hypothetical protein